MIQIGLLIGLLIITVAFLIAILSKPLNLNKNFYLKTSFILVLITSFSSLISNFTSISIFSIAGSLSFFLIFAFVLLHSSEVLGNKKTVIFFILAFLIGLFFEIEGVIYGEIGGGHYYYTAPSFFFGLVPFATPMSWVIIIYICYTIANLFLFGFNGDKPKKTNSLRYFIGLTTLLSVISGLIAVNLDMILDPVSVAPQVETWVWVGGGPYFGIPIGNFVGWVLVAGSAVFIFRCYERIVSKSDVNTDVNIFPYLSIIILYMIYFLLNAVYAFKLGKVEYILIGTTTMWPFILIGILALMLNAKKS
ncbi:MAG: carotenoid biosynthesis protein [Methanobacterium sp.]